MIFETPSEVTVLRTALLQSNTPPHEGRLLFYG